MYLKRQTQSRDLVIYLQARTETLVERVAKRVLSMEHGISETYLARLADAYSRFFYRYEEAPLLIVNSDQLNFVDNHDQLNLLLQHIGTMRGRRGLFNVAAA